MPTASQTGTFYIRAVCNLRANDYDNAVRRQTDGVETPTDRSGFVVGRGSKNRNDILLMAAAAVAAAAARPRDGVESDPRRPTRRRAVGCRHRLDCNAAGLSLPLLLLLVDLSSFGC
jgi:hypothetical protein